MTTATAPITLTIAHQLGRMQARQRIDAGFARMLQQMPGSGACSQRWDGDRMSFSVALLGQAVSGTVDVLDTKVVMQIELPGMLGMIANAFRGRLQKAGQLLLTKE